MNCLSYLNCLNFLNCFNWFSSKQSIVYFEVQLKRNDQYYYNYEYKSSKNYDKDISIYMKSFVSSKIRDKLYIHRIYSLKPFLNLHYEYEYYFPEENCHIKLIYKYI